MNRLVPLFLLGLISFHAAGQDNFKSKEKKDAPILTPKVSRVVRGSNTNNLTGGISNIPAGKTFVKPELQSNKGLSPLGSVGTINSVAPGENPRFIEVKRDNSGQRRSVPPTKESASRNFLNELKPTLKVSDKSGFALTYQDFTKAKLKQTYKGIEIHGKEVVLHFNEFGEGTKFMGHYSTCNFELDTISSLLPEKALQLIMQDLSSKTKVVSLTDQESKFYHYEGPVVKKVVYEATDFVSSFHLAYEVEVKPNVLETWKYFIDADNGIVLKSFSLLCSVDGPYTATAPDLFNISRTINTYLEGTEYKMINTTKPMYDPATQEGAIITLDAQNTDGTQFVEIKTSNNVWNNHQAAVSAHYNAGVAYDYYFQNHGRNSINGKAGTIYSFVNVADENGQGLDNAYWNGYAIFYGNGDVAFEPLAKGLDVAGHEMTHGVVQNTANLEYYGESGAINESMADIFGFMMDPNDWTMGEDVVKTAVFPSGALRNLQDPHNGGTSLADIGYQPKHVSEKYIGSQDNNGVHINSGIPNHAFYLLATSTTKTKAAAIFYNALSNYLTRFSDFVDLRIACVQSAKDLHGDTAPEVALTEQAFDGVGIVGTSTPIGNFTTLPVNPGQDYLLTVDIASFYPGTLYRSNPAGDAGFIMLSQTDILSRPSVTDDGTYAVYVGTDHKIYGMDLSSGIEETIDSDPIWSNAAISKDGTKLASVTVDQDTSIYVYDFTSNQAVRYILYNPTYSSGIKSGGPVYADALEWDYSGEHLVYDAFNSITNISGTNIEYWDVNFIQVWNKATNDFGDGEIEKLFSSLPEGVSIGNPIFAKNSPYVIAFDYTENDEYFAVLGINLEKNETPGLIFTGNTLSFPSYSKLDNKIGATFATPDNTVDGWHYATAEITLNADKTSAPSGNSTASLLVDYSKYPVFYTMGTRNIVLSNIDKLAVEGNVKAFPNPFDNSIHLIAKEKRMKEVLVYDVRGALVAHQQLDSFEENINTSQLTQGMYIVRIVLEEGVETFKMIKN